MTGLVNSTANTFEKWLVARYGQCSCPVGKLARKIAKKTKVRKAA